MHNDEPAGLDLVGTTEAMEMLGVDRSTISRWAAAGTLPLAHQLPGPTGAMLFRRADVEAVRARRAEEAAEPIAEASA